ncbi:MAG: RND transporter [Pirellulales bacterium]
MLLRRSIWLASGLGALVAIAGCSQGAGETATDASPASSAKTGHTHGAWWCDEHGVPEEVCGLCDRKVAAEMKAQGDWCGEHDRPDSQCFVCHPEYEAQFAAQYEAKYGKKPPKPTTDG